MWTGEPCLQCVDVPGAGELLGGGVLDNAGMHVNRCTGGVAAMASHVVCCNPHLVDTCDIIDDQRMLVARQ